MHESSRINTEDVPKMRAQLCRALPNIRPVVHCERNHANAFAASHVSPQAMFHFTADAIEADLSPLMRRLHNVVLTADQLFNLMAKSGFKSPALQKVKV
jgi:hypothetical protein